MTTGPEITFNRKRLMMPAIGSAILFTFSVWASTFPLTEYQAVTLEIARAISCVGLIVCGAALFIPEWFITDGTLLRFATFIAILAAIGFGYLHFARVPKPTEKSATAVKVCRGEYPGNCLPHDVFVGCSEPNEFAKQFCPSGPSIRALASRDGNHCGYSLFEVTCPAK
jgi:hypothetical protein